MISQAFGPRLCAVRSEFRSTYPRVLWRRRERAEERGEHPTRFSRTSKIFKEFPSLFRGLLPTRKMAISQKRLDEILWRHPLRVPGKPPHPLPPSFHAPQIGGSLHWWSYNSSCHVTAFTVKLKHAHAMSLGSQWRLQFFGGVWEWGLCMAVLKWGEGER